MATDLAWAYDRASEARPNDKLTYRVEVWRGVWTPILHRGGVTGPLSDPCGRKQQAKEVCEAHYREHYKADEPG